jgi:Cdc6-like AAA superfamily ATPase
MVQLLTLVEEAARSTEAGVKHFIEPAPGTLKRATSKRHHIVFGRRGSGKSSLLRKAAADLTIDRRPIAYVNLEGFKGHSYPDVLLSVLISTLKEFKRWMDTAAIHPPTRTSFWKTLFGTTPTRASFNKNEAAKLAEKLGQEIEELNRELHRTDAAELTVKSGAEASEKESAGAKVKVGTIAASAEAEARSEVAQTETKEIEEKYAWSKTDFLHRHILDYQSLFHELGSLSGGDAYLFLDDLYHIRRADQAKVVDYFHRLAKDHNLWLKVGTIRHRTRWYIHGDPPTGMKIGDDADEIDLDLTLEKYSLAKDFLTRILNNFAIAAHITSISSLLTDGALDRLVLASGGVARDFLSIFRRSVNVARERGAGQHGGKVGAEDVNVAAGEYDSSKREEFKRDTLDDNVTLEDEFQRLREFCLDTNNTNCFLLDKEQRGSEVDLIHELVDLKLIHLARSRVTVSRRPGRIYEAYMLDLSQYAGARKRRKLQLVEFWKPTSTEALRKVSLIYAPTD